jgi:hypothetical protein
MPCLPLPPLSPPLRQTLLVNSDCNAAVVIEALESIGVGTSSGYIAALDANLVRCPTPTVSGQGDKTVRCLCLCVCMVSCALYPCINNMCVLCVWQVPFPQGGKGASARDPEASMMVEAASFIRVEQVRLTHSYTISLPSPSPHEENASPHISPCDHEHNASSPSLSSCS